MNQASIVILEATHFLDNNKTWTKGKFRVVEVFKDKKIQFECFERIGTRK